MKTNKCGSVSKEMRDDRALKLKMIKAIQMIEDELKLRKLKFKNESGLFTIYTKGKEFMVQLGDGETITGCWVVLSKNKSFELCEIGLDLEEFLMELDDIISDIDKLYKLKTKIDKKILEIENLINDSDIHGLEINEWLYDEMSFENIILTTDN